MARRSTVELLDPMLKAEVDKLLRDGKRIDDVVEHLRKLGDDDTSRSAVARYAKNAREQMKKFMQAQEMAKLWVGKIDEDPNDDLGRLLSEMLKTIAWQQMGNMPDEVDIKDVARLAKTIKDLAGADKITADRELKIREQVAKDTAKKAATEAVKAAKKGGASVETLEAIRAGILGLAA